MDKTLTSTARLNNGVEIPYLGLGVYLAGPGAGTRNAVQHDQQTDYRHIDTARSYGNEREVGTAVRNSRIPKEKVFIATKLWNSDHGYDRTITACEESLMTLGLSYVDLYLIHWPLQHDIVVIPKSANQQRIYEKADVFDFEISSEDLTLLDSLNEDFRVCWDPSDAP